MIIINAYNEMFNNWGPVLIDNKQTFNETYDLELIKKGIEILEEKKVRYIVIEVKKNE